MANGAFVADILPVADTSIGPGSLALFLGSDPGFSPETVWFNPIMRPDEDAETMPRLVFDPENRWWRITEQTLRNCEECAAGRYLIGCPDLVENFDILASLRGAQELLMDAVTRPDWVRMKIAEINEVWFEAYGRIYDIIATEDGWSAFWAFMVFGPGKCAKVQCDASSMISPELFIDLVLPSLSAQCAWLDRSMFHLDGSQCLQHLDTLLGMPDLDAVEWTPDPPMPTGGNLHWAPMYRKILSAGKAVQLVGIKPREVEPMLDAVGGKGIYFLVEFESEKEAEALANRLVRMGG
jgi:hypothetical protein